MIYIYGEIVTLIEDENNFFITLMHTSQYSKIPVGRILYHLTVYTVDCHNGEPYTQVCKCAEGGLLVSGLAFGTSCECVSVGSVWLVSLRSVTTTVRGTVAERTRGLWLWYLRRYVSVIQLSTLKYVVRETS